MMKPIKITAELLITPEMFKEWCNSYGEWNGEFSYKHYVEKMLYGKFGAWKDIGGYDDFINKKIEDNGNSVRLTIEEL